MLIEEFLGPVALHPLLEDANVLGLVHVAHGNLMTSPIAFALFAVNFRRTRPTLGSAEDNHRPDWALHDALVPRRPNLLDFGNDRIEHAGKLLVDRFGVTAFHKIRFVSHALKELLQFLLGYARQEAG